jgi:hypothetical protein
MYKQQKRARRGPEDTDAKGTDGLVPPGPDVALGQQNLGDRLETSLANLTEARKNGHPFGFEDKTHFDAFMTQLNAELSSRDITGTPKVQGSAMHSRTPGDVDVEIVVTRAEFERLAKTFLSSAPEGHQKADLRRNIEKGKIPSFQFFPDAHPSIGDSVKGHTQGLAVQATLIVEGTDFDLGPTL